MPARFELHGIAFSGPTYKVGLMLSLAGEPFDYVHVNMMAGEHKQPPHLAKQRFGQVPLLIDRNNGRHLCQSAAILEYVSDTLGKFGGATLDERLQAREWLYWDFDRLAPAIYRSRAIRRGFRKGGPEILDMCASDAAAALTVLDQHLAGKNWIVGEGVTIADIDIYGVLVFADDAAVDLAPYANISAWMKRFEALPGFSLPLNLLPMENREAA
ncbi:MULTISPECIES: glutathione S-transferase family protein [Microvirga]|uniref:glutathione S-transferase family protein n=1 Tax=Microvirga TaxID=186650 RepID=UPI001CFFA934|nr:glutathione S-transferase family protein [Microvirga lenta]MCB5177039.1 glutathione S-transferase family protein [Microvirga lenta]